jgi:hypothetical protein
VVVFHCFEIEIFFFFTDGGWLVALSVFSIFLFCLRENGRMTMRISEQLDRIEAMQDRIEYLEESLYEFY